MSRTGVSYSWMVELHSKVAHIRKKPATKQVATSTGTLWVYMQMMLAAIITIPQIKKVDLGGMANFSLNIITKVSDMPARDA